MALPVTTSFTGRRRTWWISFTSMLYNCTLIDGLFRVLLSLLFCFCLFCLVLWTLTMVSISLGTYKSPQRDYQSTLQQPHTSLSNTYHNPQVQYQRIGINHATQRFTTRFTLHNDSDFIKMWTNTLTKLHDHSTINLQPTLTTSTTQTFTETLRKNITLKLYELLLCVKGVFQNLETKLYEPNNEC